MLLLFSLKSHFIFCSQGLILSLVSGTKRVPLGSSDLHEVSVLVGLSCLRIGLVSPVKVNILAVLFDLFHFGSGEMNIII